MNRVEILVAAELVNRRHSVPTTKRTGIEMSVHNRSTIHMTGKTVEAFGIRMKSGVVNQTMQRLTVAVDTVELTESDRQFYNEHRRVDRSPGYPDQSEILKNFAKQKGCDLSTALVCLEKLDRE